MKSWQLLLGKKERKYPIQRDEFGQSLRQRAFSLFREGHRPAKVIKVLPVSMKTACRYFEDWKKQKHKISLSHLKKLMKKNPEFSDEVVGSLAEYFSVPTEQVILRMQKPWGLMQLMKGELRHAKIGRARIQIERRLEAALRLIMYAHLSSGKSPEEVKKEINRIIFSTGDRDSEQSKER